MIAFIKCHERVVGIRRSPIDRRHIALHPRPMRRLRLHTGTPNCNYQQQNWQLLHMASPYSRKCGFFILISMHASCHAQKAPKGAFLVKNLKSCQIFENILYWRYCDIVHFATEGTACRAPQGRRISMRWRLRLRDRDSHSRGRLCHMKRDRRKAELQTTPRAFRLSRRNT